MTNAEKYLKEGADLEGLSNDIESYIKFYGGFDTKEFFEDESWCNQSTKAKPTLTEDERVILRNSQATPFEDMFQIIGRNSRGKLFITGTFCSTNYILNEKYQDLFRFIKERRRILY